MKSTPFAGFSPMSLPAGALIVLTVPLFFTGCDSKEPVASKSPATDPAQQTASSPANNPSVSSGANPQAVAAANDSAPAAPNGTAPAPDTSKFNWPRTLQDGTATITIYQPEIEKWDGFNFQARFAVSIQDSGQPAPTFGVIWVTANSNVDKAEGVVTLNNIVISKTNFPADPNNAKKYTDFITSKIPAQSMPIPLDQINNRFLLGNTLKQVAAQPVKNTPPNIIFSDEPALLILIDGTPVMRPLAGTDCSYVFNSSSFIVQNTTKGGPFYLRALNYWFRADNIAGPWVAPDPSEIPSALGSILQAGVDSKHFDMINPTEGSNPPAPDIYVSTVPAELVQTDGQPSFVPIHNTQLLEVKNSDNAIILNISNQTFYVLISGRWFSSPALTGKPWTFMDAKQLPTDFAKIPPDSDKGNVLASVPGTPQAKEAVIANSIPQTATVDRQAAKLSVTYDNDKPQFAPVAGTSLKYAINTPTPVIQVTPTSYYSVSNGVWFDAASPVGPWAVATAVPPVIYTIPVASPIHYVTYVQVYGYTDSVVYVGYTPGYYGTIVTPGGVVVYGNGYVYPAYIGTTVYVAPPPTYGYGASVSVSAGTGFLFGFAAGVALDAVLNPYWGCWGGTTVNVYGGHVYGAWGTAVYRGPAYGYHGGYAAVGYNPYNGNWAAATRSAGYNPRTGTYGASRSVAGGNAYTGQYGALQQGAVSNPRTGAGAVGERGVTGNAYTGNYNAGREGAAYNPNTGRGVTGATSVQGNAYNGNWGANQSRAYNDTATGAQATSHTTAVGNSNTGAYASTTDRSATSANGSTLNSTVDKSSDGPTTREGTVTNSQTGESKSWDHTQGQNAGNGPAANPPASSNSNRVYSDSSGNVYKPNSDGSGYQKATSNGGWQNADKSQTQGLDRQNQGWGGGNSGGDSSGGSRWGGGGDRWGGGNGGGGGSRFGGGDSGGGGGRWGGGGGGRSWR